MTRYIATIRHHSIAKAREINIDGTLSAAKRAASKEFGDEFLSYEIVIYEEKFDGELIKVSSKLVGAKHWKDGPYI